MKFNMETVYIPYSTVFDKRDMMFDWIETSNRAAVFGWFVAIVPLLISLNYSHLGDFFEFSLYFSSIALVIGGAFCKKWKIWAYCVNIIALLYCNSVLIYYISEIEVMYRVMIAIADILGMVMVYWCLRCIYNYKSVYKMLEKENGFPNFMVNGQDLYSDKLYVKENSTKKQQYTEEKASIIMNINDNPSHQEIEDSKNKKHKHGLSVFGINIVFPHDDLKNMDNNDKRGYMYDWNCNVELITKGIFFPIMFMIAGVGFCAMGEAKDMGTMLSPFIGGVSIILLVLGTTQMNKGKLYGAIATLLALFMYFGLGFHIGAAGNGIPCTWITVTSLFNIKLFLPTARYVINYPVYKALSKEEGFPTFIRSTADLYGSELYMVEKQPTIKKRILSDNEKIEMNIDSDNKPKKEDKAWNAFDYMDEDES